MLKLLLILPPLLYLTLAAVAFFTAERQLFLPPVSSYDPEDLPVRLVETEDGVQVAVLHLPSAEAEFTLLYAHGNAEDLGHGLPTLRDLASAGFSVLAFDYRGYGASTPARPTARGAVRDMEAVLRHAVEELGIPPRRIVLYGRSVGSGPATELAARHPVAGLVIESGFTSVYRVVTGVRLLPFDLFPNVDRIGRVRAPVLVIHGTRDEVIPIAHGRKLFEAAGRPKQALWVEGAGHNDLERVAGARYRAALREFQALLGRERQPPGAP